jgi:hypothetical protein
MMLDTLVLEVLDCLLDELPADALADCLNAQLKGRTGLSPEATFELV